ncbi:MAG TPA: bifunctional phosphoribosylaminoimidazolecarboxamide formyltransferase/inosine monophosphate cyclohydrolase, partial [Alphaproteobacteria bacterium]|nr:bifunctional phosphoribosylaminoimidazolecarboxamide formyltransferase/inosine monophosphate cyclohydrolase [Alphaproteobacteria bacterium]
HDFVTVVCDPADYSDVLAELAEGDVTTGTRRRLAGKVFARTAAYDRAIAGWLSGDAFGETMTVSGRRLQELRYGENPHQRAAVYAGGEARPGVATATQLQG